MDSLNRPQVLDSMIHAANTVCKEKPPENVTLKRLIKPKGVLVCGDLTDAAKSAQWQGFKSLFGLNGEQKLKYPLYETFGNHDGDIDGVVRMGIKQRNNSRKISNKSANGLFYSWDWGKYHFVSLGIYPGNNWDSTCNWCHYFKTSFRDPQNSLDFLQNDLRKYAKGKRIILYYHYGFDDFSMLWWTKAEQDAFYKVIAPYNIGAIFVGHDHTTGYRKWRGIDIYSAGSPQHDDKTGTFLVVQVKNNKMFVLERQFDQWGKNVFYKKMN